MHGKAAKGIVVLCLFLCLRAVFSAPVCIQVPRLEHAPPLGGGLESRGWRQCAQSFGFSVLQNGTASRHLTRFALGEHGGSLYVAVRCELQPGTPLQLKATETKKDGKIYFDDSIDLALARPDDRPDEYCQFSLNSINARYDARCLDVRWDGQWESQAETDSRGFTLYWKIPFEDLGYDAVPAELKFNLGRTVTGKNEEQSVLIRQGKVHFFEDMQQAASLRFASGTPVLKVFPHTDRKDGALAFSIETPVLPEAGFVDTVLELVDSREQIQRTKTVQTRFDCKSATVSFGSVKDGHYRLRCRLKKARIHHLPAYYGGGGDELCDEVRQGRFVPQVYASYQCDLEVNNRPDLQLGVKLEDAGKTIHCLVSPLNVPAEPGLKTVVKLWTEQHAFLRDMGQFPFYPRQSDHVFRNLKLHPRTRYYLTVEVQGNPKLRVKRQIRFSTPPEPEWMAPNPDDPGDRVIPPWTPVRLRGLKVGVWGREYEFSRESPLPVQLVTKNQNVLAAPARLLWGPERLRWELLDVRRHGDSRVRFQWRGRGTSTNLSAAVEVYFDGIIRLDVTVPPHLPGDRLALEIPIRRAVATHVHRSPIMFGGILTTYPIPEKTEFHQIRENIHLLKEDVGFCWFDGMKFDWKLKEPCKAIAIVPGRDEVTLRVNYIDQHRDYDIPRTFSCGMLALPVRPLPKNSEGMRTCYSVRYGEEDARRFPAWLATVDYPARGNIRTEQGTVEFLVKPSEGFADQDEVFFKAAHGDSYWFQVGHSPRHGLYACVYEFGMKMLLASGVKLAAGEWKHVAVTWGRSMKLFLDGKQVCSSKYEGSMKVFPSMLQLGGRHVYADALRISRCPRQDFQCSGHVVSDGQTLLADNFERTGFVNGRRATFPEKVSPESECGYLMPDTRLGRDDFGSCIFPLTAKVKSRIEGYAHLGIKNLIYHASQYTDEAFAGLYIAKEDAFRRSVAAIHQNGMRAIMYVGNSISSLDRLWDTYADQWLIEPRGFPFMSPNHPGDKGYQACPRSDYFKYFVWRIGHLMDEYRVDGIFLDGRMYATCSNARQGCGVTNFEGIRVPERDLWDGRRKTIFLYHVVKKRGGYAEEHKSGNWDAPVCFYWDLAWEGEQLMNVTRGRRKRLDICPLDAMRIQMNGRPYGVPARFSSYSYAPFTPIENATLSFVHGTSATMSYRIEEAHVLSPYWAAMDRFGADQHNFVPYWSNNPPALETPLPLVKVSAWKRPGKTLLVIANFDEDHPSVSGEVRLSEKLVGKGRKHAHDAFSGVPIHLEGLRLKLDKLKSFRQTWIVVEEKP